MFDTVIIALLVILSIVAMAINTFCIYVIIRSKSLLKRPSTLLLLNLLIVHLLQSIIVFPFYAAKKGDPASRLACDGFRFTYMLTFYLAVLSVTLITADRAIATFLVMKYKEIVCKRRILLAIFAIWIYTIFLCILPFNGGSQPKAITVQNVTSNSSYVIYKAPKCYYKQTKLWTTLMLLINCVIPYGLIVLSYQCIIRQIYNIETRSRSRTLTFPERARSDTTTTVNSLRVTEEVKKNKTITNLSLILSIVYLILWLPSVLYYNILHFCPKRCFSSDYFDSTAEMYIGFLVKYVAFLDALAAPLIYCFYHQEFRNEANKCFKWCYFTDICCRANASRVPEETTSSGKDAGQLDCYTGAVNPYAS